MSYVKNAMIECWEAGAVPVGIEDVRTWRAEGHSVPVRWVPVDSYTGAKTAAPAITPEVAERLAGSLDDERARVGLAEALDDYRGYVATVEAGRRRRQPPPPATTAARLAAEIIACVARGDDLPDEWHKLDAYADIGEPVAAEVCRLVREDLAHTSIRP